MSCVCGRWPFDATKVMKVDKPTIPNKQEVDDEIGFELPGENKKVIGPSISFNFS